MPHAFPAFSLVVLSILSDGAFGQALVATPEKPSSTPVQPGPAGGRVLRYGTWGIDLDARDLAIRPGDDFFSYASGSYFARTPFPPDRVAIGVWDQLFRRTEEDVRDLIQQMPERSPPGSLEQKIRDYYRAFLDTETIERAGLKPVRPILGSISTATTHADIARLMARPDLPTRSVIDFDISVDEKNPNRYVVVIEASSDGFALPARDYYLNDEPTFAAIRQKYRAHLERMLALAGERKAAEQAQAILELETAIAERHWPEDKLRERDLTYNPRTREELLQIRGYPWKEALRIAGLADSKEFVLGAVEPVERISELFLKTPVRTWQSYLRYHVLTDISAVLPKAFDDEAFDFYGRTLAGRVQQPERWKRAVGATNGALGEAVGRFYVQRHFPPESKAQMLALVTNLRRAFESRIQNLAWMSPETKAVALEKLATFKPKIGYPDKWRDYAALEVRAGDALGNQLRASAFNWQRNLERLRKPTDRDEWFTTPQTVNAFYNPVFNEIVFPAAFLQPPFFDPQADAAVNYGAIGTVIGHEMGHGFDDQGSKSDAHGVLRTWWRAEDEAAFKRLGDQLATQFDQYEVLPGLNVRGRLVLGENIADLAGLHVAFEAYRLSLGDRKPIDIDGLTGEQRFFMAFAQCWRVMFREQTLRSYVMRDPHSPPQWRVNGILRNVDAWYSAFNVQRGDKLFLAPEERIRIW